MLRKHIPPEPAADGPPSVRLSLGAARDGWLLRELQLTNRIMWQLLTPEQQDTVRRQTAGD